MARRQAGGRLVLTSARVAVERIEVRAEGFDEAAAGYGRIAGAQDALVKSTGRVDGGLTKTAANLLSLDAALSLAERGVRALQAGFNALKAPVGLAVGFEREVQQVRTLGADLGADFDAQLRALGVRLGRRGADLARASYDAISAGIQPERLGAFVETAALAATAGAGEVTDAVQVLTTGVNAFKEVGGDATTIADQLFATIRLGVTDFGKLAATDIGASVGQFAQFAEVGAQLAVLTKRGQSTSEALTTVRSIVDSLIAPSAQAAKEFKRLGVETGAAALQSKGLTTILGEIQRATGGSVAEITKLSGRMEAQAGLILLAGEGFEEYIDTLAQVRGSAGATAQAAALMAETSAAAQARFAALIEDMQVSLGQALLPTIDAVMTDLAEWAKRDGPAFIDAVARAVEQLVAMGRWAVEHGEEIIRIVATVFVAERVTRWVAAVQSAVGAVGALTAASRAAGAGIFSPQSLSTAFQSAVRSPLFIGVAIAAAGYIGTTIADRMHKAMLDRFRQAEAAGVASVDTRATRVGEMQRDQLAAVDDANLARVLDQRGAEGLREFGQKQRAELLKAAQDLAQPVAEMAREMIAAQQEAQRLVDRERTAGHLAATIKTVDEFRALDEEGRAAAADELGRAAARYATLRAEMEAANAEAAEFAQAADALEARVAAIIEKGKPKEAPKPARVDPRTDQEKARAREIERAAREALLLSEVFDEGERRLLEFDMMAQRAVEEARKVGADVAVVQSALDAQRVALVEQIADGEQAIFDGLAVAADQASRATMEALRVARAEEERLRRVSLDQLQRDQRAGITANRPAAQPDAGVLGAAASGLADISGAVGGIADAMAMDAELTRLQEHHGRLLAEMERHGVETNALRERFALEAQAMAERIETAQVVSIIGTSQAAAQSLAALAQQAGASAQFVGVLEKLALGATAAQEIVFAMRDGAAALTAGVPGPLFNPIAAVGYGISAAAHAATAALAGAKIAGLGGSPGAAASAGSAGAPTSAPTPAPLPPATSQQALSAEVHVHGVVATDRRAATGLGRVVGERVLYGLQRDTGSRGSAQVPARAEGV